MVGVEGPRAWWGVGLARHAGHTEAILQQRQLFTRNHQGERKMRKRKDNDKRWRRNNSGGEETIREGEEEEEGKGGRRKVHMRMGEKGGRQKRRVQPDRNNWPQTLRRKGNRRGDKQK